jgi:hypothetical protein
MTVPNTTDKNKDDRSLGTILKTILGIYFVLWSIMLAYLVYSVWPIFEPPDIATGTIPPSMVNFFGYHFMVEADIRLILLVMVTGALGGHVHAAISFANYVGDRRLYTSWVGWYLLRAFVGFSLALVFYFVIRGGFLSTGASAGDISPYGIAALSALVGMYSEQAAKKLKDIFEQLFTKPEERGDKLTTPKPNISGLDPKSFEHGGSDVVLNITGSGFVPESVVQFDGVDQKTNYVNPTKLTVDVPGEKVASSTNIRVTVLNPSPDGGTSNERTLKIN